MIHLPRRDQHLQNKGWDTFQMIELQCTFVNCGHLKKFLLLPDLKIW